MRLPAAGPDRSSYEIKPEETYKLDHDAWETVDETAPMRRNPRETRRPHSAPLFVVEAIIPAVIALVGALGGVALTRFVQASPRRRALEARDGAAVPQPHIRPSPESLCGLHR